MKIENLRLWRLLFAFFLCVLSADGYSATAVVTSTNGVERMLPLASAVQPDGGLRFTVRAVDAQVKTDYNLNVKD